MEPVQTNSNYQEYWLVESFPAYVLHSFTTVFYLLTTVNAYLDICGFVSCLSWGAPIIRILEYSTSSQ